MAEANVVCDLSEAEALAPEWDALAVADGQPMASAAWMLGWWRHAAPAGARLRIVVVRQAGRLVGLVPFYVDRHGHHRLLADVLSALVAPLARPGREWAVAQAAVEALHAGPPRADALVLERLPVASPWLTAFREHWPGRLRPLAFRYKLLTIPTVVVEGTFDDWLATRSGAFRRSMRRLRRRFDGRGGTYRRATAETVAADIETFMRLHCARWEGRGESHIAALGPAFAALLRDVAAAQLADGRFRLWLLELDGEPICADLSLAAGGEVVGYNGGWDERHAALSPPRLAFLRKIEECFERGDRRLSLGWGMLDYKRSYANGSDLVGWDALVPVGPGLPGALAGLGPRLVAGRLGPSLKRNLSDEQVTRLQGVRERARALRAPAARRRRGPG